jgi:hypothetical protein
VAVAGYAVAVVGYAPLSPNRCQQASRELLASPGPQGPGGAACDEGGTFGGWELIFKISHTKKFCGNRLSTNELRLACKPLTGPRRVYKWAESGRKKNGQQRAQGSALAGYSGLNHWKPSESLCLGPPLRPGSLLQAATAAVFRARLTGCLQGSRGSGGLFGCGWAPHRASCSLSLFHFLLCCLGLVG